MGSVAKNPSSRRMIYHGLVQGVGFRATTDRIARRFAVSGYVRNLPDGTVEVVAQGESNEVDRFLAEVESQLSGYISGSDCCYIPQDYNLKGFTIRFGTGESSSRSLDP